MSQSTKVLELKKHVAVIHSSNKLSLLQRKIANALLFNAYKELQEKDEHTIHIAKLCDMIGYDSHDHKSIKIALINLISTVLEWNLVDGEKLDSESIWNASSMIAGASIKGAICTYSYSSQMKKLLYRPHVYGRLDMLVQAKFQSTYGLALYENCNRFQDIGQTPWFSIAKFRKLMGVEEGKYKIFRDFKSRVLDKAIEEVNKHSPLEVSAQLRKQNRQVISIQFLIKKTNLLLTAMHANSLEPSHLPDILKTQFNLSVKQIKNVLAEYEVPYIKEKMDLVLSSASFKKGKVKSLARYLLSALRDDYQMNKNNLPLPVEVKPNVDNKSNVELQTKFRRFQEALLFKRFDELSLRKKTTVIKKFEKFLVGIYQQIYLREGLKNILIQDQLCSFLKKINHDLINKLPSYEAWLETSVILTTN
ncbi:MAG: replication initiation protein [Gammaproteobacteria bacterium]|nr:replication initiation protein [Gammaproteobacteria bacterium]